MQKAGLKAVAAEILAGIIFTGLVQNGKAYVTYSNYLPLVFSNLDDPDIIPQPTNTPAPTEPTSTPNPAELTPIPTNAPVPTSTPISMATVLTCDRWEQALRNPSFEDSFYIGDDWRDIYWGAPYPNQSTSYVWDGSYSALFYNNGIYQEIMVPNWAENGALYFAWLMVSEDSPTTYHDGMNMKVMDADTGELLTVYYIFNTTPGRGYWHSVRLPLDNITNLRGRHLSVSFNSSNDNPYYPPTPTYWYIDKVWLVFGCGSQVTSLDEFPVPDSLSLNGHQ